MKNQFITRVFLSSLVLVLTSLFGGGNLLAQTTVFYESFDQCAGTGGNDGTWGGISQGAKLTTDNEGWTFANGNGASKCARFGTKSGLGSATTPALNFEGDATLTFKAGAWKGDGTTLQISISGGGSLSASEVTMTNEAWTDYSITITGATTSTQIKFEGNQASKARFFLDEVKITQASSSDPGDTRTNPELAYGVSEYNATIGQTEGFPTLTFAEGVEGITYSSDNPDVATVDTDGNVTLKGKEGTTTITASISGSQTWKDDDASYTLIVSKPSANLAYSANSCTVIVGEAAELPTLTYAEGVDGIVYASSNTEVATVDATGKVTLTGAKGTTVISATLTDNATFADGSASYTLTVTDNSQAQESSITFDFSGYSSGTNVKDVTLSKDGITISSTSNATTDDRFWTYDSTIELRTYAKNVLSVTAETGKSIKSVTFVTTNSSFTLSKYFTITPNGTINGATWTVAEDASSTNEVSFTCTSSMTKQSVTGITVTYNSADDPSDTRTNPELAYGVSEYNATIGQTDGFPVLTYADGVTDIDIVYSSSDPNVATVEADGKVTLKGIEGSTTIKASISGSKTWRDDEASYTLTVSKPSANLAYSASSCTVIVGESPELPTLTYAVGVEGIVYESSNTEVATVNETGEVALTGAEGTTVISATFAGNDTFAAGSASYTLTVTKSKTYRYKKVTATEDLMDGGQYVIVAESEKLAKGPDAETNSVGVNIDGEMIVPTESAVLGVYTLEAKDGGYALKYGDNQYLTAANKTDITGSTTAVAWTVTIDADGNAFMRSSQNTENDRQILAGRSSTTAPIVFKNYASSNAGKLNYYNIQLYQKVYPLTVSSATGGYATFYNEEEAYQMPEGLTGYAVTKAEAGDCITRKTAYEAGATVPAKTPLLIIGTTDGGNYYPAVVSGTGVEAYAGSNLLEGKRDANGNTLSAKDGSVYYYKLGLNSESKPGFYWGAEGGDAFKMTKATTAYLAVPQSVANGANALFFDFGGETGINEIQTEQADKAIFDLSGRRVQKATKGFYIVGGKKVLVK